MTTIKKTLSDAPEFWLTLIVAPIIISTPWPSLWR